MIFFLYFMFVYSFVWFLKESDLTCWLRSKIFNISIFNIGVFMFNMFQCYYCLGFHVGWITYLIMFGLNWYIIIFSFVAAAISKFLAKLYQN